MKQAVLRSHLPRGVWPREGYTWVTSLTSVGDTNSTLGDTNSTLGDINSTLGDINSTLGDSTTVSRIIEKKNVRLLIILRKDMTISHCPA